MQRGLFIGPQRTSFLLHPEYKALRAFLGHWPQPKIPRVQLAGGQPKLPAHHRLKIPPVRETVVLVMLPTTRSQDYWRQLSEVARLQPVEVLQGRVQRTDRFFHLEPKRT